MTYYQEHLDLQFIPGRPWHRRLKRSYSVTWRDKVYTVPAGYEYDGSTIPRLLWPWLGGRFDYANAHAGALHDAAYDGLLLEDAQPCRLPPMAAHAMWCEVRTQMLQDAAKWRLTRWRLAAQGWLAWLALVGYYYVWGHRSYVK